MFHRFATSVTAIYRQFRLSKNEFRKRRDTYQASKISSDEDHKGGAGFSSARRDSAWRLYLATSLVVSIPIDAVAVLGISIDIDDYLRTPVESLFQLKSRLSKMPALPQGKILCFWPRPPTPICLPSLPTCSDYACTCICF